jgi:cytochrome c biogenesis protein
LKTDQGKPYMPEDYTIGFLHYGGARYTGLQVTRDPGVWVVYTGFILLCIGPLVAFFGSHKKLWIRLQDRNGMTVVTVAGTAHKNRIGFERELNSIADEIAK